MATIVEPTLKSYDIGQFETLYFQENYTISAGIGIESDVVKVVALKAIKVHIQDCSLHETISTEDKITGDTALFNLVSDGLSSFTLDPGVFYLKAINTSATEIALFNITCV